MPIATKRNMLTKCNRHNTFTVIFWPEIHVDGKHDHHCVIEAQNIFRVWLFDEFSAPHFVFLRLPKPVKFLFFLSACRLFMDQIK